MIVELTNDKRTCETRLRESQEALPVLGSRFVPAGYVQRDVGFRLPRSDVSKKQPLRDNQYY
jgi:hypothetical protein